MSWSQPFINSSSFRNVDSPILGSNANLDSNNTIINNHNNIIDNDNIIVTPIITQVIPTSPISSGIRRSYAEAFDCSQIPLNVPIFI